MKKGDWKDLGVGTFVGIGAGTVVGGDTRVGASEW